MRRNAAMIVPNNLIALPPSMEVAVAYCALRLDGLNHAGNQRDLKMMLSTNKGAMTCRLLVCMLFISPSLAFGGAPPVAEKIEDWKLQSLPTDAKEHLNISAVTMNDDGSLLVVGADEASHIQILKRSGESKFTLIKDGNFALASDETELDIEGIARDKDYTWVIGSHSMGRKSMLSLDKLKQKQSSGDKLSENYNRERIATVAVEPTREWLYRLEIDNNGSVRRDSIRRGSMRDIFANHPVLGRFQNIPSKENGVDIEGLAVIPGGDSEKIRLFAGLRGPLLRGPLAVVLEVAAKDGSADDGRPILRIKLEETHYLALGGRGVRGMSGMKNAKDGYLILAGPVGGEPTSYMLYHWNGEDSVPEINTPDAIHNVTELCRIPPPEAEPGAKAEGVHFLLEEEGIVKFVIVYDSAVNGAPTVFSCHFGRS
jgi:hypothetical protein